VLMLLGGKVKERDGITSELVNFVGRGQQLLHSEPRLIYKGDDH
jgi:hypothetical protein